ncbi:methylation-associated defense system restriction endonuclease subunit S MAD5 [Tamlana crocina]|uniref:Type I restriction modification DNA specificity domain-containing protein n=1 Tax=Tamlana crocina TaxID=393006 RepID=A0ABX1DCZ4_9FLAO|nr:restriction endonuclease subunit S [Tamlana crocina]NJX15529.1 hypothetical protein [Tamlana crocina]
MKVGKINFKYISDSLRFNSDFHLSEGVAYDRLLRANPHFTLENLTTDIFCAGRSKRIYVSEDNGYPYLGNTDISSTSPLSGCNYASKKFWNERKGFLKEGMILTGRVGQNTVGAFSYTSKELEGCIGSDNVIRIVSNGTVKNGYLYAYLASKYGYHLARRHISGNAQPFITEDMLSNLPVPIIPKPKEEQIHNLIIEAADLRLEANNLLNEADEMFHEGNGLDFPEDWLSISENEIKLGFSVKNSFKLRTTIKARNYSFRANKIIEEFDVKKGIKLKDYLKIPLKMGARGSFKRIDSKNFKGHSLLSQTELHTQNPKIFKQVRAPKITEDDIAKRGQVLIPAAGNASGEGEIFVRPTLVRNNFEGMLLSEVIGKLECKTENDAAYLFIFLKSKAMFRILRAMIYGTSLRYPNWELIKDVNIPLVSDKIKNEIGDKVLLAFDKRGEADKKENQAINLIENEIEQWQES